MNKLFCSVILIYFLITRCRAKPSACQALGKCQSETEKIANTSTDLDKIIPNFGLNGPESRVNFEIFNTGQDFISLCWNERTVLNICNGKINGYVDYSISMEQSPQEELASSPVCLTEPYEICDQTTNSKRVLDFATIFKNDTLTIKENRTVNCKLGQMYAKTFTHLPKEKRVEIKLRSELSEHTFQPLKKENASRALDDSNSDEATTESIEITSEEGGTPENKIILRSMISAEEKSIPTSTESEEDAQLRKTESEEAEADASLPDISSYLTDEQLKEEPTTTEELTDGSIVKRIDAETEPEPESESEPDELSKRKEDSKGEFRIGHGSKVTVQFPKECDDGGKVKVKLRLGLFNEDGETEDLEKDIQINLEGSNQNDGKANAEDALTSVVRNYFGTSLDKYEKKCSKSKNEDVGMRSFQDDDSDPAYRRYSQLYRNRFEDAYNPPPTGQSYYRANDGQYYLIPRLRKMEDEKETSFLEKVTRKLKDALYLKY